jgi:hypothetical protein
MDFYGRVVGLVPMQDGYQVTVFVPEPGLDTRKLEENSKEAEERNAKNQQLSIIRLLMSRLHFGECWIRQAITDEECGLVAAPEEAKK